MKKWLGAGVATVAIMGGILATGVFAADNNPEHGGSGCGNGGRMGAACEMKTGFHGGQTFMAETIAKLADKPVEDVLKEKASGATWSDVAGKFGLKLDEVRAEHMKNHSNCPRNK